MIWTVHITARLKHAIERFATAAIIGISLAAAGWFTLLAGFSIGLALAGGVR